ncbi:UNVERIFIED_CONTAM: hypothetical protein HDU68_001609 [Siphonaria sp. JEL0065]|nr:hypothetical protein HDU68_001609 [Siphonaria sp. JEL0065]
MAVFEGKHQMTFTQFEKAISKHLIGFNQEDEIIRLVWRLVPTEEQQFISLCSVPFHRVIQIHHVIKGQHIAEDEYLPAYTRLAQSLEDGLELTEAGLPGYVVNPYF